MKNESDRPKATQAESDEAHGKHCNKSIPPLNTTNYEKQMLRHFLFLQFYTLVPIETITFFVDHIYWCLIVGGVALDATVVLVDDWFILTVQAKF